MACAAISYAEMDFSVKPLLEARYGYEDNILQVSKEGEVEGDFVILNSGEWGLPIWTTLRRCLMDGDILMEETHMEPLLLPRIRPSHTDRLDMEGDLAEGSEWAEAGVEDGKRNRTKRGNQDVL